MYGVAHADWVCLTGCLKSRLKTCYPALSGPVKTITITKNDLSAANTNFEKREVDQPLIQGKPGLSRSKKPNTNYYQRN